MKQLICRDVGFDCDYIVKAETENEVIRKGAEHAIIDHGFKEKDLTADFNQRLRGSIRTTQ